jgi:3'-5' exoribonuclease
MGIKQLKDIDRNYISQSFELVVLIGDVKVRVARNGKRFADIIIQDASRMVEAKYWDYEDNEEFINSIGAEEAVNIKAVVGEYQGQIQVTIKHIEKVDMDSVNIADLIPTSTWELDSMKSGLDFFYEKIKSPHMKKLLDRMIFFSDHFKMFSTHPAARRVHHNYYHGLLQHTLEVLKFSLGNL